MITPYERAAQAFLAESHPRSFTEDVELHLLHGFVHSTPEFFIMGRAVPRTAAPELIVDPLVLFPREQCDAWMVYLAAGDLGKAWAVLPWPLPWLAFERGNELRFVPLDAIKRLSTNPPLNPPPP